MQADERVSRSHTSAICSGTAMPCRSATPAAPATRNVAGRFALWQVMPLACAIALLACIASLLWGAGPVGPVQALKVLVGQGGEEARFVVSELRAPRSLIGIVVGMMLACGGALMQVVARNPLAEPGLLGVSAGASFAVAIALLLGVQAAGMHVIVAQSGALLGCLVVMSTVRARGAGQDPVRLVLAGAALSSLLVALTSLVLLIDQRAADEIRFWVVGSLAGRSLSALYHCLPSLLLAVVLTLWVSRPLAALVLGEQVASGLGHRPERVRQVTILVVALLVGAATALAGPVAFVGLAVPYVARALCGADIRRTLWLCMPLGVTMLLTADVISRLVVPPSELPLGVLTTLLGAPVLIAVVRARRLPTL